MKKIVRCIKIAAVATVLTSIAILTSCDFLDVVPPEQAQLKRCN